MRNRVSYGDIEVCWLPELEGGGRSFGQDYLPVVEHLFGRVDRAFELCAGAGCIGFSLLAHGLCDSLALADVNPVAVEAARETVRGNGLEDRVTVYLSDGLADVPDDEQCDLFVANPPFFLEEHVSFLRDPWVTPEFALRSLDPGLQLHERLYREIPGHLRQGGNVLIQGCSLASPPDAFHAMIEAGGLDPIRTLWFTENESPYIYYVWAKRASPSMHMPDGTPAPTEVELRRPAGEPVLLATHTVHVLNLRNCTGEAVEARVEIGTDPDDHGGRSLVEIPAGGRLQLPQAALHPDARVVFRDERDGAALATLESAPGPDAGARA